MRPGPERGPNRDLTPPTPILVGAGLLLSAVVILAAVAEPSDPGRDAGERAAPVSPVDSRWLSFRDQEDGSVRVVDDATGRVVHTIPPESNFFTRGVLRSLVRQREKQSLSGRTSFRLTLWSNGRLTLEDTSTATEVELTAFGPTNRRAFRRFLDSLPETAGGVDSPPPESSSGPAVGSPPGR